MSRRYAFGMIVLIKNGTDIFGASHGSIGTGLLGCYPNKGGIGLSVDFALDEQVTTMCLVVMHLGAHEGASNCAWRTVEFGHIYSTLGMASHPAYPTNRRLIPEDHELIFCMGTSIIGSR